MPTIHPTAIVHDGARLGDAVDVGPYCFVGPDVEIGPGTRLMGHAWLDGWTRIGAGCTLYPFASIGTRTQDLKYAGGRPGVRIGDRTVVRESVTVNAATQDGDLTCVGSDCLLMAYAHVAHDCLVGDRVIIANCGTLAGHVVLEDECIIGGLSGVHQFVRVGRLAIVGGCSKVTQDVPPFMMADGHPLAIHGINRVGLERRGVGKETQSTLKEAYRILYRQDLATRTALEQIEAQLEQDPELTRLIDFVRGSQRGITK
jgi:UDP-N-acetylglucosamine acyltransferase